jgi:hypothetical protein
MWPRDIAIEDSQRTDVLKIPGNRSNINAYILKLVDIVFGRGGLEQLQVKQVRDNEGYLFIRGKRAHCMIDSKNQGTN